MRSRSDVLREKQSGKRPSAGERTVPLPPAAPGALARCDACGADSPAEKCTTRADGFAECPECGAPVVLAAPASGAREAGDAAGRAIARKAEEREKKRLPEHPERKFCGECGSEWPIVGTGFVTNCGHSAAERVDDPGKARKYGPPAGLHPGTLPGRPSPAPSGPSPAPAGPSPNRLSLVWGEARLPYDQFNGFKVGGHIASVDVLPGEDRVEVGRRLAADLEKIADELFDRQKAWYDRKLRSLAAK